MKLILSLLFLLVSLLPAFSSDVRFYNINNLYGISMRETYSICKDDNGFIWASSKTGILRIAGDSHHIYQLPYESSDVFSTKLIYQNGCLYAYSNNGQVFFYDELLDRFMLYVNFRQLFNSVFLSVHTALADQEGALWVSSSRGFLRYKDGEQEKIMEEQANVNFIDVYDDSHLFVAMPSKIVLLNKKSFETKVLYEEEASDSSFITSKLYYDSKTEYLWIGTNSNGLYYYDMRNKLFAAVPIRNFPKQPVLAIANNTDTTLLIGIDGQGIWELNRTGTSVLNIYKEDMDNPFSIHGDGVYDIFCDENKRVWVTTYTGGLSFFEQESPLVNQIAHRINTVNSLGNNNVNKIIEDRKGNIWFATNNGISRWKPLSNQWDHFYQNKQEQAQVFLALCEDDDGNIWAGTYSSGVYVLDGNSGKELHHYSYENTSDFNCKFIFSIYKDSKGNIWIGGIQSDVFCYQSREKRFLTFSSQPVNRFWEFSQDEMLVACSYGLVILNTETNVYNLLLEGYYARDILVIDRNIWIATAGGGLICYNYDEKSVRSITTDDGLVSNYINSLMYANGYLWLGSENGLCSFNPLDDNVMIYSSILPLFNVSYNQSSGYRLKNGDLIWGTNNGAVMFDPNLLYEKRLQGQIFFQDISILGRSIRGNSDLIKNTPVNKQTSISLRYNQNTLTLDLLPIGSSSIGSKFSWKMEGLDTEWTQPSDLRNINYTNIPIGDFSLRIRMYDSSLSQIINERFLDIQIVPPFWKTVWFRFILLFVIGMIAYLILRFYINRLKQRHTEDKISFFTNTAHDIRTSLTLISAPIEELNKERENLSERGRYYLSLASEQSGRLSFVSTQLLDFQKVDIGKGQLFLIMTDMVKVVSRRKSMFEAAAKRNNITLDFSSDREEYLTAVDELKIEKVVDNLISNAVKYSHPGGNVEIKFSVENEKWELEVRDYGLGISEKAKSKLFREFYRGDNVVNSKMVGSGIGLLLVKNYVTMHGGTVSLDTKENQGSSFRIVIPYKEVPDVLRPESEVSKAKTPFESEMIELPDDSPDKLNIKLPHLLLVEDNNDLQDFLKHSFSEYYKITTANDGVEAWEIISKKQPELVISDVMMPNMDGFELCRLIKSTFDTSHIPVILLTALSEKSKQLEGLGLGADDYITKPFDVTLLSQRIRSIMKNREVIRGKALKLITQTDGQPILSNELNDQFMKKALDVVRENMTNSEFGKDEFASAMHVSSSLLYKKTKALTGQSPIEFIKTIRLNHSLELLQSKKHTVTEVSELSGFSSVSYFSTVFKKHFGKSPTDI